MILKSIRVRGYKNVKDSGEMRVEDDVTCLVGKNESGKSAMLQALYRLNPAATGHPEGFVGLRDYPRLLYSSNRASIPETCPITAVFELDDDDLRAVEEVHGHGVLVSRLVTVAKSYRNELEWEIECAAPKIGARDDTGPRDGPPPTREPGWNPPEGPEHFPRDGPAGDLESGIRSLLRDRLPKFLYFDECSVMSGRLSILRLQGDESALAPGERTALSLMRLAAIDFSDFTEDDYEARRASLEAAANRISGDVLEYWSQDPNLSVEFDIDSDGEGAAARGQFIEVRVRNERHRITLNFNERSRGFVWFFSFLATLSELQDSQRLILLLDEPSLGLHAEAQQDLLRFIDERLAHTHQIVYSTHSPFMVAPSALQRVRTLEDREDEGAVVSTNLLAHSAATRTPLRAALGHALIRSLRTACNTLIVQEPSDHVYLTVMSGRLEKEGRSCLDPRWTIAPAGGLAGVARLVAMLEESPNMAIVSGAPDGEAREDNSSVARVVAGEKNIIHLPDFTGGQEGDVEDLFAEDFYVDLVNRSDAAAVEWFEVLGEGRIVERIRTAIGAPFNRYLPARLLLESQEELLARVDGEVLDCFEALFRRINESLGSVSRQ